MLRQILREPANPTWDSHAPDSVARVRLPNVLGAKGLDCAMWERPWHRVVRERMPAKTTLEPRLKGSATEPIKES